MAVDYRTFVVLSTLITFSFENCYEKSHCDSKKYNCHFSDYYEYELHCYMIHNNKLESEDPGRVYSIEIYSSNLSDVTPEIFYNFPKVNSLSIIGSNIRNIRRETFLNLPQLAFLNLTNNNISVLSGYIPNHITNLILTRNVITTIEQYFLELMPELLTLQLSHNSISDASPLMENCGSLFHLALSYNNINKIEFSDSCSTLDFLNVSHNNVSEIIVDNTTSFNLNTLDLSWNSLSYIKSDNLKQFSALIKLDLSNNPLFFSNDFPVDLFQNKQNLQYLNLAFTGIRNLVIGTFSKMVNLQTLNLSHNSLRNLPKGLFHDLIGLNNLYLNDNHIAYFEYTGFGRLNRISLDNNLWTCDVLSDLIVQLQSNKIEIMTGSMYDSANIFGISCSDTDVKKTYRISENISDFGLEKVEKEYYIFLESVQENLQKIFLRQQNFYNSSFSDLSNHSKTYWEGLSRDYRNFSSLLRKDAQEIVRQITGAVSSLEKMSQNSIATTVKTQNETLFQWSRLQAKFVEVLKEDLNMSVGQTEERFREVSVKIQEAFTETMAYIKENLATHKMLSEEVPKAAGYKSDRFENVTLLNDYKAMTVGIYCILFILLTKIIVKLVMHFKTYKQRKTNHEECNPLSNMQV